MQTRKSTCLRLFSSRILDGFCFCFFLIWDRLLGEVAGVICSMPDNSSNSPVCLSDASWISQWAVKTPPRVLGRPKIPELLPVMIAGRAQEEAPTKVPADGFLQYPSFLAAPSCVSIPGRHSRARNILVPALKRDGKICLDRIDLSFIHGPRPKLPEATTKCGNCLVPLISQRKPAYAGRLSSIDLDLCHQSA